MDRIVEAIRKERRAIRTMGKIKKFIFDSAFRYDILNSRKMLPWQSDKKVLQKKYKYKFHRKLDLENPKTFNEKLQWLKLYNHNPLYTQLVDKYEAKDYMLKTIGAEYVIPTIGVWDKFEDINFDEFPDEFVLKCTHDSGGLVVVRDKATFDKDAAKKKIGNSLSKNYFYSGREWPYKNVKPRIIAEPLIHNQDYSQLLEYNFFCFNGEPKIVLRCSGDRDKGEQRYNDYYKVDGEKLPFRWGYPYSDAQLEITDTYSDMLEKARLLSKDIPFVRVDFYVCDGKALIGEMTFFHWSGLMPFDPDEWDEILGGWLTLPVKFIKGDL